MFSLELKPRGSGEVAGQSSLYSDGDRIRGRENLECGPRGKYRNVYSGLSPTAFEHNNELPGRTSQCFSVL